MPRASFNQDPTTLYHITARCRNKDWFELPIDVVWELMSEHLHFAHHAFNFQFLAFVLMQNHYHMIAQAPRGNMSEGMQYFMRESTRTIQKESGRINQIWGARFFRSRLVGHFHLMNCYKYVYRNPVAAGICERVENYQYSTLHGLTGQSRLLVPVTLETQLFEDLEGTLTWLNKIPEPKAIEDVRKAVRKPNFALPKINKRKSKWESALI